MKKMKKNFGIFRKFWPNLTNFDQFWPIFSNFFKFFQIFSNFFQFSMILRRIELFFWRFIGFHKEIRDTSRHHRATRRISFQECLPRVSAFRKTRWRELSIAAWSRTGRSGSVRRSFTHGRFRSAAANFFARSRVTEWRSAETRLCT